MNAAAVIARAKHIMLAIFCLLIIEKWQTTSLLGQDALAGEISDPPVELVTGWTITGPGGDYGFLEFWPPPGWKTEFRVGPLRFSLPFRAGFAVPVVVGAVVSSLIFFAILIRLLPKAPRKEGKRHP